MLRIPIEIGLVEIFPVLPREQVLSLQMDEVDSVAGRLLIFDQLFEFSRINKLMWKLGQNLKSATADATRPGHCEHHRAERLDGADGDALRDAAQRMLHVGPVLVHVRRAEEDERRLEAPLQEVFAAGIAKMKTWCKKGANISITNITCFY